MESKDQHGEPDGREKAGHPEHHGVRVKQNAPCCALWHLGAREGDERADEGAEQGGEGDHGEGEGAVLGGGGLDDVAGADAALGDGEAGHDVAGEEDPLVVGDGHAEVAVAGEDDVEEEDLGGGAVVLPDAEDGVEDDGGERVEEHDEGVVEDVVPAGPSAGVEVDDEHWLAAHAGGHGQEDAAIEPQDGAVQAEATLLRFLLG